MADKCAVCKATGYWVAYSFDHNEYRCINHLEDE